MIWNIPTTNTFTTIGMLFVLAFRVAATQIVDAKGRRGLQMLDTRGQSSGPVQPLPITELLKDFVQQQPRRVTAMVLGGETAPPSRFPYFVSLRRRSDESHYCGGSLVAADKVLTAAHCIDPQLPNKGEPLPIVHIGRNCRACPEVPVRANTVSTEFHPNWTGNIGNGYDVAILKLDQRVRSPLIEVAPSDSRFSVGQQLKVIGFGYHDELQELADDLQLGTVEYLPAESCREKFLSKVSHEIIRETMMCAFSPSTDACQGDSGGPLILPSPRGFPSQDLLVGVVSAGVGGCVQDGLPAIYTNLAEVSTFLRAHLLAQPPMIQSAPTCQESFEINWLFGVCPYELQFWRVIGELTVISLISSSRIVPEQSIEIGSDWGVSLTSCRCPVYTRVFVKIQAATRDQADRIWNFVSDDRNVLWRIRNTVPGISCTSGLKLSGRKIQGVC